MRELWNNLKNWQKAGMILGFVAIITVVVIIVVFMINAEPKVRINFAEKNNIPASEIKGLRERLVGVIRTNTEDFDENMVYVGNARGYNESVDDNSTTATFVVDFDDIKESYAVMVTWPDSDSDAPNIVISCPLFETKYPETVCNTESNSSEDIVSFLPYKGTDSLGESYEIIAGYNFGKIYLEIETNGDVEEAVAATKRWMADYGFNLEDYLVYVPSNRHIQVNHAKTNDNNVNEYLPYFVPNVFDVSPVVDVSNNVTEIKAVLSGCTDYQTDPVEADIKEYLESKKINYPVNFEYCAE